VDIEKELVVANINECNISQLYNIEDSFNPQYIKNSRFLEAGELLDKTEEVVKKRTRKGIFKYLEHVADFSMDLQVIKSISALRNKLGEFIMQIQGLGTFNCSLPIGCLCHSQYSVSYKNGIVNALWKQERTFQHYCDENDVDILVSTNSAIYSDG